MRQIIGSPARGSDFHDREELIARLWQRLDANSVLLAAPRRFGKTSVMYHLLDHPKPAWRPIHVDAESIREPVNFVIAVLDALMEDSAIRKFMVSCWRKTCGWMRGLLDEIEATGPYDVGLKVKLKAKLGPNWQEHGDGLLRALRDYNCRERLLFIIDELPVMLFLFRDNGVSDPDTRAFLYWFRKIRTDPKIGLTNSRFLVGGSIGIEHCLFRLGVADSFNDFERITVGELDGKRAAELVSMLLDDQGVALGAASRRKLLELIGMPIPYFIQIFVAEIAAASATGPGKLGPSSLERIYREKVLGVSSKNYFHHYYDRLQHYDKPQERAAKEILKRLALVPSGMLHAAQLRQAHREAIGEVSSGDDFTRLIESLENDFYLQYRREDDAYTFASKVLRDWWARYYAV